VPLMMELSEKIEPAMKERNIQFSHNIKVSKEAILHVDKERFKGVLKSLLSNAQQFTPVSAQVRFEVDEKENSYVFRVIDNGEGLPRETKKNVFERFRTKNRHGSEGIGLGLYISKKIIELHEGSIWAEDTVDGGVTFVVEVPK